MRFASKLYIGIVAGILIVAVSVYMVASDRNTLLDKAALGNSDNKIKDIAAGSLFSLALMEGGSVYHWGMKLHDAVYFTPDVANDAPQLVEEIEDIKFIDAKWGVAAAHDGALWVWGSNGSIFDTEEREISPRRVEGLAHVSKVAIGNSFLVVLQEDGTVWSLGTNYTGQLGNGDEIDLGSDPDTFDYKEVFVPAQITGIPKMMDIAAGDKHALALAENGTVWAWGANESGQLGDGTDVPKSSPKQIESLSNITAIDAGYDFSMALTKEGEVWAWGSNSSGEIGDGTPIDRNGLDNNIKLPSQTKDLSNIVEISAGLSYALALDGSGNVWEWGDQEKSYLGEGHLKEHGSRSIPKQVAGLDHVASIAAGMNHSLAMKRDGTMWGWGDNGFHKISPAEAEEHTQPVHIQVE
ncbi:hypothetical protein PAECIP111893_00516 [Paenibacillus plantiphilus]|uniref:RCC1-like domain-containing protein n=1 Tax=Paenibacillus plantiphilus TaxID=2905650 RepID=A0ABM9BS15_9BACL|nr:hypothetical protein [Paenibacillus plantiphilus]CAH1193640.1 hypothetical protein PAECIP111893_00516 [Paenibacillus plantiphilus]